MANPTMNWKLPCLLLAGQKRATFWHNQWLGCLLSCISHPNNLRVTIRQPCVATTWSMTFLVGSLLDRSTRPMNFLERQMGSSGLISHVGQSWTFSILNFYPPRSGRSSYASVLAILLVAWDSSRLLSSLDSFFTAQTGIECGFL